LEQFAPATVRNVVPKPVSLTLLTEVLRRLVEEGVSIRDLRAVLEALSTVAVTEKDPLNLAEHVRSQLRRAITYRFTRGAPQLGYFPSDPPPGDPAPRHIPRPPAGAFLTVPPAQARDLIAAVKRALAEGAAQMEPDEATVILTQPDIRRFVRKLLETDAP